MFGFNIHVFCVLFVGIQYKIQLHNISIYNLTYRPSNKLSETSGKYDKILSLIYDADVIWEFTYCFWKKGIELLGGPKKTAIPESVVIQTVRTNT